MDSIFQSTNQTRTSFLAIEQATQCRTMEDIRRALGWELITAERQHRWSEWIHGQESDTTSAAMPHSWHDDDSHL